MTILTISAIVGKILLWILLIFAVILLLVLFAPITYKIGIVKKDDTFTADGNVGWLFHLIHVCFSFDQSRADKKLKADVRVLGISLLNIINKLRQRSKNKKLKKKKQDAVREIRWEAPKKPTVEPGQRRTQTIEITKTKRPGIIQRIAARIQALIGKIKRFFRKLRTVWHDISGWIDYLQSDSFGRAKDCLIKEGAKILRHALPRKISGFMRIGTGDPANTGFLIGILQILYPVFPKDLCLEPEFLESCFEADVQCKGHVQLVVLIYHIVRMILQKDVRRLISRIRGQMKKGKRNKKEKVRKKPWQKTMNFRTT